MPSGPATTRAIVSRPLRAVARVFAKYEKSQLRRRLLFAGGAFQLLAVALIIGINVAGLRNEPTPAILAPYTYLVSWDETVNVTGTDGPQPQTYTVMWYLNALCVRNGSQPVHSLLTTTGEDFNLTRFRSEVWEHYILAAYTCDSSNPDVFNPREYYSNATNIPCRVPTRHPRPPPQGLTRFASRSFALYTSAAILATVSWLWHLVQCYDGGDAATRRQEQDSHLVTVLTPGPALAQAATLSVVFAASGMLTEGISEVVLFSGAGEGPRVAASGAGLAGVWSATVSQLLGSAAFLGAFWIWRVLRAEEEAGRRERQRQRPSRSSLPMYRPRDSRAADQDELPPYQRDDPMGNPPGIDSLHHPPVETRLAPDYCIPLSSLGEGGAGAPAAGGRRASMRSTGRLTPSPEYQEHPVLPLSPLSRHSGLSIGGGGGAPRRMLPDQAPVAPPSEASVSGVSSRSSSRPASSAASARVSLPEDMQAINRPSHAESGTSRSP